MTLENKTSTLRTGTGEALHVLCWGTRGSVPSPGPATVRYGGNTPCLELRLPNGKSYIFDAGTGIVPFGQQLTRTAARQAHLFLTHFHADHIQGLPFFAPLDDPAWRLTIHATPPLGMSIDDALAAQMQEPYFPIPLRQRSAQVEYLRWENKPWTDGDVEISAFQVRHPGIACGYRIRHADVSIVYIPDNEIAGADYDVSPDWEDEFNEFIAGADVLIHDAMYTDAEYRNRRGWGHSTFEQAVQWAEAAAVRQLLLFHHAPDRTDAELAAIVRELQRAALARNSRLIIEAAAEGNSLILPARRSAEPGAAH